MAGQPHPYYANLVRIVAAHPEEWSLASFSREAGLDQATIRIGLREGSRPSMATVEKVRKLIGLDYDGVMAWNGGPILTDPTKAAEMARLRELLPHLPAALRRSFLVLAEASEAAERAAERGSPPERSEDDDDPETAG